MNINKELAVLIEKNMREQEANRRFAEAQGSAQSKTFIAELSDTKFELTEAEKQHLDDLLAWQERSAKSLIRLGGTGEAPNGLHERPGANT